VIERSRVLAVNDLGIGGKAPASTDSRERRAAPRNPTITLLVTPDQAAQLELASVRGTVGIALCAGTDAASGPVAAPGITTSGMLGITIEPEPTPSVTPPPAPPPVTPEPAEAEKPTAEVPAEPPKPQVWEVVVVRGENTVKHGFPIKAPPTSEPPAAAPADPKR